MRPDQIAFAVIFAVPFLLLILDWYVNSDFTEIILKYIKLPWVLFTIAWMTWTRDWGYLAILIWIGLALFIQPKLKSTYRK